MDYRKVYMKIISNAIKENRKKLSKDAENYVYYEAHHILPKSLFPAWSKRKSNIVLLTAREHFFCHQLLTKIWPGRQMSFALAAFVWGYNKSSGRGVWRNGKYKMSSREYEKVRKLLSEEFSKLQIEVWQNKSQNEMIEWTKKHSKAMLSRTDEQRQKTLQKYRETLKNRTKEEWEAVRQKQRDARQNKTEEELLRMHNNLSKNIKGKFWFNNGSKEILAFECPKGFTKGRIPDTEARVKAAKTNRERNKIRGTYQSRMTLEEHQIWRQKISESHKKIAKEAWANMSEEAKQRHSEKISNSLKGHTVSDEQRKRISEGIKNSPKHKETVEKVAAKHRGKHFFNNGEVCILAETCPEGFVPGMIKGQGSCKNSKEK